MKHGHRKLRTPTYRSWQAMKERCFNEKSIGYKRYGGKGITVCERWKNSFENFLADMGERPEGKTIDRIDHTGNYEPSNCKWSTRKEQARNTYDTILDEDKVRIIKKLIRENNLTQKEIGNKFGVSLYTISKIKLGKIWRDVI
jgi:hypothetical protein